MILQALKEYYDRKAADPDSGIAPLGWERKEIPFRVVFDSEGKPIEINNTMDMEKKVMNLGTEKKIINFDYFFLRPQIHHVSTKIKKSYGNSPLQNSCKKIVIFL